MGLALIIIAVILWVCWRWGRDGMGHGGIIGVVLDHHRCTSPDGDVLIMSVFIWEMAADLGYSVIMMTKHVK